MIRFAGFAALALALPNPGWAGGKRVAAPVGGPTSDAAERQAAARGLFQQGLEGLRAERWADAADRFERALALKPTPEIAYNLSSALLHLGKLVRASEVLRQAAEDADAAVAVRQAASTRLQQVLSRIAYLTVRLDGPPDGVTVSLDRRQLETAVLGVAIPVDPGRHTLTAVRGEEPIYDQALDIKEGERVPLTVVVPTPTRSLESLSVVGGGYEVAGVGVAAADPASERSAGIYRKWWFWTIVGAVAVGTVTAIAVAARPEAAIERGTIDTIDYVPRGR